MRALAGDGYGRADLVADCEVIEAAAWSQLYGDQGVAGADPAGLFRHRVGEGWALGSTELDILAINRVIGLGRGRTVAPAQVDSIVERYRAAGVPRLFVQVAPDALPESLPEWLRARGLRPYNRWVKLYRSTASPPQAVSSLRLERIEREHAAEFASVVAGCFGWPRSLEGRIGGLVGQPGWHHYLAFDGQHAVATSALFVRGEIGWIDFAATLPEHRGRGAQSALIARRVRDAASLGCRRLVVEAAEGDAANPPRSRQNLERLGFREAYRRQNYLYESVGTGGISSGAS